MRICLVIHGLCGGGAERVLTVLGNCWVQRGHEVHVICSCGRSQPPFYPLDARITRTYLEEDAGGMVEAPNVSSHLARVLSLRSAISRCDPSVVLSFIDKMNVLTLLSTIGLSVPVVACEHTYPKGRALGRSWELLRRLTYPHAAAVVALTGRGLRCFSKRVQALGAVIPNPITVPAVYRGCRLNTPANGRNTLITLGWLTPVKGHDMLVSAFARVTRQHPTWSLEIWGEGPCRPQLRTLIQALKLGEKVHLPGVTREPFEALRKADLYVCSSRTEGFPMALCEAMACGLPVVSFDCATGPRDIIRDGVDGVLVVPEDVDGLATALGRLMGDEQLRRRMGQHAPEILERFSLDGVMRQWEVLFARVTRSGA